ncbi:MAG: glycosyltransferase [Phycisphaerae bacterium]|nr:glycosyltransferase [Phycisphaerae bacterium]
MRGGERCLEAMCELYPDADIFTLVHRPEYISETIESHKIYTSFIRNLSKNINGFRKYLPLFPYAIRKFDLSGYDFVMSFSHCVAKDVAVPAGIRHICYCHTPMRYAWNMRNSYLSKLSMPKRLLAGYLLNLLKKWDRKTSAGVTSFIANSKNVQRRIKDAYDRDSTVIYPPVDCSRFILSKQDDGYYLIVSALVEYKRIDLAVEAFRDFGRKLIIAGNGSKLAYLKSIAGKNIHFINNVNDIQVAEYMQKCTALIFPGEEDFGITPLEAQACGKSVIAFGRGGALETVCGLDNLMPGQSGATGVFFYEQNVSSLQQAILKFEERRNEISPQVCRENALRFDRPLYQKSIQNYIQSVINR